MAFGNELKDYPAKSSLKVGFNACHYSEAQSFIKSPYCFELYFRDERVHLYEVPFFDGKRPWQRDIRTSS
jgi:hypothetical protein